MRMGTVAEVDYDRARVRVKSGNLTTAWLPWAAGSANSAKRRWDPPEVGEQVVVLSPTGDMRQGLVLTGVFQQSAGAPSANANKDTTVYGDGTVIEYDRASHTLLADLGPTKITATRTALVLECNGSKIELDAAGIRFTATRIDLN
jgi:phage baseplate assembly protein V